MPKKGESTKQKNREKLLNYISDRIKFYWESKRTFETTQRSFNEEKFDFKQEMDKYFDLVSDDDNKFTVDLRAEVKGVKKVVCQRISQVEVTFNTNKLKDVLNKKQQKSVIRKHYQVNNWPGLLGFLKESGVEWKEFIKYVDVSETVDEAALEKLVELGEVDTDEIIECSNSRIKTQYYKLTEK
ncbi:MAG: hypothetical protein K6F77_08140 [Lachnospiraceae bacterium]|nr:hypothetical protein [Lachnospiraceae bacterium]